jgi:hypothetical protein
MNGQAAMPAGTGRAAVTSTRALTGIRYGRTMIDFTCVQCGYHGRCDRWYMTCPRCWVPMLAGTPETWWARRPGGKP